MFLKSVDLQEVIYISDTQEQQFQTVQLFASNGTSDPTKYGNDVDHRASWGGSNSDSEDPLGCEAPPAPLQPRGTE